jgi:hypothetical protein
MVVIVAVIVAALALGGLILLAVALLRCLVELLVRVMALLAVGAGIIGASCLLAALPDEAESAVAIALVCGVGVLAWDRRRRQETVPAPEARRGSASLTDVAPADAVLRLDPALHRRLTDAEAALTRVARDAAGQHAAEWLVFWQRRVPDLITAATDAHAEASGAERARIAAELAERLTDVADEAERRLAAVQKARMDLFQARSRHAQMRITDG